MYVIPRLHLNDFWFGRLILSSCVITRGGGEKYSYTFRYVDHEKKKKFSRKYLHFILLGQCCFLLVMIVMALLRCGGFCNVRDTSSGQDTVKSGIRDFQVHAEDGNSRLIITNSTDHRLT